MFNNDFFRNKRVLLTGGASGLGQSLLQKLLDAGAGVHVVDRMNAVTSHPSVTWITADIRDFQIPNEPFDIVILNAGTYFGGPFTRVPLEHHLKTFEVNLLASIRLAHQALPQLMSRHHSRLCFISSITGYGDVPYATTYASSKAGLLRFAESLRIELAELKISNPRITTICPSTIETKLFAGTKSPLLMPVLSPNRLAEKILRSIACGKPLLLEPFFCKFIPLMNGLLPWWLRFHVSKLLGVNRALESWKGQSH